MGSIRELFKSDKTKAATHTAAILSRHKHISSGYGAIETYDLNIKCSISAAISAFKLAPCFPDSSALESLPRNTLEEGFKHAVLLRRQDKCTFQQRRACSEAPSRLKNPQSKEMKWVRTLFGVLPQAARRKEKKKNLNLHGLRVTTWDTSHPPQKTVVTTATHLRKLTTWHVHAHMKEHAVCSGQPVNIHKMFFLCRRMGEI